MHARQIRGKYLQKRFTRNVETLYSSQYCNIMIIANARETVNFITSMCTHLIISYTHLIISYTHLIISYTHLIILCM